MNIQFFQTWSLSLLLILEIGSRFLQFRFQHSSMGTKDQLLLVHHHSSIWEWNIKLIDCQFNYNKFTYLIVCHTLEIFVWNVFSDSWAPKASINIFFFSYYVSAIWFEWFAEILVWKNFLSRWLTMNASSGIPWVITLHILDTVHVVRSWSLSLS